MTVEELIEQLQDLDPNAEVRLAIQPNYPFQHNISNVVTVGDECEFEYDDEEDDHNEGWWCNTHDEPGVDLVAKSQHLMEMEDAPGIVYIAEGGQVSDAPYLPAEARAAIGW